MNRNIHIQLLLLSVLTSILFGYFYKNSGLLYHVSLASYQLKGYQYTIADINNSAYKVYIADTDEKRGRGLSNVKSLRDYEGMLFQFDSPDYHEFWMKDMRFPLDFIFINEDTVVDVLKNVSPSTYPSTFSGKKPYAEVIELNAGQIEKSDISIGDKVIFKTD